MRLVAGKIVAVVGRAWYLGESGLGPEIDSAEYIVRINWTLPIDPKQHPHVGSRTDLLYTMQIREANKLIRKAIRCRVRSTRLNSTLRREMADSMGGGLYIPNTGTVAIVDALKGKAKEVRVYGFDLHTSNRYVDTGTTHDNRAVYAKHQKQKNMKTHNPDRDRELLRGLLSDPRFKPDAVLLKVLSDDWSAAA